MSFMDKKTCAICGENAGRVFNQKIANDLSICNRCKDKCTPGLTAKQMKNMTVEQIRQDIQIAQENRALYRTRFEVTRKIKAGTGRNKPLLNADENNGWFVDAREKEPYVYRISDIVNHYLALKTSALGPEEKKRRESAGYLEWLYDPSFYDGYPEQPRCPEGRKITAMKYRIELSDNELGIDELEFDVMPGMFSDKKDIMKAYEVSHDIYEFLTNYHNPMNRAEDRRRMYGSAAAPQQAGPYANPAQQDEPYRNPVQQQAETQRNRVQRQAETQREYVQQAQRGHGSGSAAAPNGGSVDVTEKLKKLKEVYDLGLISEEEYRQKKEQILAHL